MLYFKRNVQFYKKVNVNMKKAVIIGAGPAGLCAALELLRAPGQYQVCVLEESGEIGGISRTVRHGGNRMDIGGHRFFSKDENIMNWWKSMMPLQGAPAIDDKLLLRTKDYASGGPNPETEDRVMLLRQRVSRIYYGGHFFDYPISMSWATIKNMGFLTTVKAGFSYLFSLVHKKPEISLENFYINRFGKVLYGMFFEGYTEKLWGRHPKEISADWGAQRVKGLSIAAVIKDIFRKIFPSKNAQVETSLIEEFWYPKYGPGQLWETVAQEVQALGGTVEMNAKVDTIVAENGKISSLSYTQQGQIKNISADVFISSMPVKELLAAWQGAVPKDVATAAKGLPYRDFVTVGLLLNRLKLANKTKIKTLANIVPDCWIYIQEGSVKVGRLQIFNNWSPYLVKDPQNTVWVGMEYFCTEGDDFWQMDEAACVNFAIGEMVKMGIIEKDDVLDTHREKVKKAYPAYFDTYAQMDDIISFLNGHENLYCIGRNGQHRYNNMDHSMATAMEAVKNICSARKDKDNVWNVNTEKEYHEKKEK